jgi:titin
MHSPPPARARLRVEPLEDRLAPATFTITNASDAGAGSLRAAIMSANALPGADTIRFHIAGDGVHTIDLFSALPLITGPLKLAGRSQPGYAGSPLIELNGASAGPSAAGLAFAPSASGSVVRGLAINRFQGDGIRITADNCRITACRIGTNPAGTVAWGNETGIRLLNGASGNVIGGVETRNRNVISGNGDGVRIEGEGTSDNVVLGNLIGTSASGRVDLGNGGTGVLIASGASGNMIGGISAGSRNIISGNNGNGVTLTGASTTGNWVKGNFIGTDETGSAFLGNLNNGISIEAGASDTVIGGFVAAARNVISGNSNDGILISSSTITAVRGNFIGTDRTGAADLGNAGKGILLRDGAAGSVIGGTTPGTCNVISGNGETGVWLQGVGTTGNSIQGNRIGLSARGPQAIGNDHYGIFVGLGASSNTIGGTAVGAGNAIAHSGMHGVALGSGNGNSIQRNRIFANEFLGIDLEADGITNNDIDDVDYGANNRLNFPVLEDSQRATAGLRVTGSINTQLNETICIEVFATPALDPDGHCEGSRFIGHVIVQTIDSTTAIFNAILPYAGDLAGFYITATATDRFGNTSEFSPGLLVE